MLWDIMNTYSEKIEEIRKIRINFDKLNDNLERIGDILDDIYSQGVKK